MSNHLLNAAIVTSLRPTSEPSNRLSPQLKVNRSNGSNHEPKSKKRHNFSVASLLGKRDEQEDESEQEEEEDKLSVEEESKSEETESAAAKLALQQRLLSPEFSAAMAEHQRQLMGHFYSTDMARNMQHPWLANLANLHHENNIYSHYRAAGPQGLHHRKFSI